MKKSIILTLCACAASALFAQKIAIVDVDALLRDHPNTESDKKTVEMTLDEYSKERDVLRAGLEKKDAIVGQKYRDAQNPIFGADKKEQLKAEAVKLQRELQAEVAAAEQKMAQRTKDLQDLEARLIRRSTEDIQAKVSEYAKAKQIDVVLLKAATVYVADATDITKEVKALIIAKKAVAATADAKAAVKAVKAKESVKAEAATDLIPLTPTTQTK